jgi:hypothetical protein
MRDGDKRIARVCRMPAELEKTKMYIQEEILPQKTRRKMVERIPSVLFCLQVYSQVFMCTCPCVHTCRSEQMNQYMNTKNRRKTKAYSKLPEASRERQGRLSLSLWKKASAGQQLQTSLSQCYRDHILLSCLAHKYFVMAVLGLGAHSLFDICL